MSDECCGKFTNGHYDDKKCALVEANNFISKLQDARDRTESRLLKIAQDAVRLLEALDDGGIGEPEQDALRKSIAEFEAK